MPVHAARREDEGQLCFRYGQCHVGIPPTGARQVRLFSYSRVQLVRVRACDVYAMLTRSRTSYAYVYVDAHFLHFINATFAAAFTVGAVHAFGLVWLCGTGTETLA